MVSLRLSALSPVVAVNVQPASATACREVLVAAHDLPVAQHCHTHALQRIERHILESASYWRARAKQMEICGGGGTKLRASWIELSRGTPGIANLKHHPRRMSGECL